MRTLTITLALTTLLSAGCATKHVELGSVGSVSESADGNARIYVARKSALGAIVPYRIDIGGQEHKLWNRRYLETQVEPGPIELAGQTEARTSIGFEAEADHTYYFRAVPVFGIFVSRVRIDPMEPGEGAELVSKLKPAGSSE